MAEIKGIERIKARILAEANEYAAAKDAESAKKCDALLAERAAQSAEKSEQILARAASDAEAARKNAVSGGESRERSEMLKLRVEMADKAFDAALAKLAHQPEDKYVPAMAKLLANAVNLSLKDGMSAALSMSERDSVFADAILAAAQPLITKKVTLTRSDKASPIAAGFILLCGDIEINCSGEKMIETARPALEKQVLDVLFAK